MATALIAARAATTRHGVAYLRTRLGGAYLAFEVSRTTLEVRVADRVVGALVEIKGERGDQVLVQLGDNQRVWARRDEVVIANTNFDRSRRLVGAEAAS